MYPENKKYLKKYLKYFSMYFYLNTFAFICIWIPQKYLYLNTFKCIWPPSGIHMHKSTPVPCVCVVSVDHNAHYRCVPSGSTWYVSYVLYGTRYGVWCIFSKWTGNVPVASHCGLEGQHHWSTCSICTIPDMRFSNGRKGRCVDCFVYSSRFNKFYVL